MNRSDNNSSRPGNGKPGNGRSGNGRPSNGKPANGKSRSRSNNRRNKSVFNPKGAKPQNRNNPLNSVFGSRDGRSELFDNPGNGHPSAARVAAKPRMTWHPPKKEYKVVDGIDPVELFMAYHLGVTKDDKYRPQNIHDLARRFRTTPSRINKALRAYEIDAETVMCTDFDMPMAQIDIRVAPEGISKIELAKQLYLEFREAPRFVRDWGKEIEEDAKENEKIYNKLK